ncbi:MAG: ABC transporter permease subunit [Anaerolineae bacterium]|jgi:ABC-type dipeptide/oligopeptide/nickel transport system permease subunit
MKPLTFWQRLSWAVRDSYFVVGSILVTLLVLMAVLGPDLAPHNPFLVKPLQWIDGELHKAPFPPGSLYPLGTDDLGRDQLSLLLFGARTTLITAFIATVVRLLLGLMMGTFAGWRPGSLFDRGVTAFTEFMASIPGLILAMLLVFAVGIQRGQAPFVVALALVGCGEVAQIMRGHVMTIRNEQYIEAARSVGLSSPEILSRHVLPNLIGTLTAMAALEMGSVLLLLGELGFVNVFIGGGRIGYSEAAREAYHYFDVPDWGAMLGTSWRWFRSYPWFPMTPAVAFFVAILGFNLFGFGLQRFIERGRFHPSGWSVLRFLAVVALILVGARALVLGTGVEAQFADMARQFDEARAMEDVAYLSDPARAGDPAATAEYIAAQFEAADLTAASPDGSYLHAYTAIRGRSTADPVVEVLDASGEAQMRLADGVSFDPWQAFLSRGQVTAELLVVANVSRIEDQGVILALDAEEQFRVPWVGELPYEAILRLVPDSGLMRPGQVPSFDLTSYGSIDRLPRFPNLLIGESAARQMLAGAGLDLDALRTRMESGEAMVVHTGLQVRVGAGLTYYESEGANVVGYIAGMDRESRGARILVAANYGHGYPGADENASGVAAMLEIARTLQEMEFIPKQTIVFAALDDGGGFQFVSRPPLPTSRSEVWTTVLLQGIGAGEERLGRLGSGSGLARAFDQSARRLGARTETLDTWRFFFVTNGSRLSWGDPQVNKSYQGLVVTRPGDAVSGTPADTPEHLDLEQLAQAAEAVTHFVMVTSFR